MIQHYKKTLFTLWFGLALFAEGTAQQRPLTNSRQNSYYTYIYKLEPADVLRLYKEPDQGADEKMLHTLVDSFKTDKNWENHLPEGNYLEVYAEKNKLEYKLIENRSAELRFMQNNDLSFALVDKQGNPVTDAVVHMDKKLVAFDPKTCLYHTRVTRKRKLLRADYRGIANFFAVEPPYRYKVNPFRARWYAFKRFFRRTKNSYYTIQNTYKKNYTGYIVFNKPMYRPHDTVKFKAFIVNRKTLKPVKAPRLLIRLADRDDTEDKIVGYVNNYHEGGYESSFVLSDSLDLDLDENYVVSLEDPASAKYDLDSYKGKDKEDVEKIIAQRKVYFSGDFRYEDYELKSVTFSTRLDKKDQWPGTPFAIYLKATDENGLPVPDGRVALTLITSTVEWHKSDHEFVPDTLWVHKASLDPVGETKIEIPDSIFPKADIDYQVEAQFLNSNNEEQSSENEIAYHYDRYRIDAGIHSDTLVSSYYKLGKEISGNAAISALDAKNDTLSKTVVTLPSKLKINPYATSYSIEADSAEYEIEPDKDGGISVSGYRTGDSLFVNVSNEHHLRYWYSLFSGNKLIDAGESAGPFYKRAYSGDNNATFLVNYIWAGESRTDHAAIPFQDKLLNVYIKQPVTVYPGQQVRSEIVVTDQQGKPVPNVDLTAWSATKKFTEYNPPFIPYFGKLYPVRRNSLEPRLANLTKDGSVDLNWLRWSRAMGLDSIAWYQFTHPGSTYAIEEPANDTITQIAPFVVKNGDVLPVHILYIDERPVYFDQARQMQRYSFAVKPGKHDLKFRTTNQLITLNNIEVEPQKKLIISVNADTLNKMARFVKMPDTLTRYESDFIDNYLVTVADNFGDKMAMLQQDNKLIILNKNNTDNSRIYDGILAGPLSYNYASLVLPGEKPRLFLVEPDYKYTFEPGLLKQKSIKNRYPFFTNLGLYPGTDNYRQYVLSRNEADSIWQQFLYLRNNTQQLFTNEPVTTRFKGELDINVNRAEKRKSPLIKNVILYRYDDPDFIMVFSGNTTDFGLLAIGRYRMFFLLKDDSYDIKENVQVKPFGHNFYRYDILPSHKKDAVSFKIDSVVAQRHGPHKSSDSDIQNDALKLKEAFNDKYFDTSDFSEYMSGFVIGSDDKQPIVGATVKVKGTNQGTVTDVRGYFRLRVPASGKLVASFIGYITTQIAIQPSRQVRIVLPVSSNELSEVVVVGYGSALKKDLTGSVAVVTQSEMGLLNGQAAGVYVEAAPGGGITVNLRGNGSLGGTGKPLIVVDGIFVTDMKNIDPKDIGEITVLKDAAATALYGSQAANGVIVINTKGNNIAGKALADTAQQAGNQQTLRKNFSDYAYWQPKLVTDANGKASFISTFPDDITNWRTFVVAMNGQKQTGFKEGQIKAYRPVSANFVSPMFAVKGDRISVLGKVLNYTPTSIKVTRRFSYNGQLLKEGLLDVKNSNIDTLNITAEGTDSLSFEYTIRNEGYFDGERRKIPLFEQGAKETKGDFADLEKDTTVSMKFDPAMGPVTFRAEASVLPVLLQETERLRNYQYLCNEQLASKLIGLLTERRIKKFLGEPFEHGKNILEIIKKIQQNRTQQGTWGWWKDTGEELWVSLHVVCALLEAEKEGYQTELDKTKLAAYLLYQLDSYKGQDKLTCLGLLKELDAKADYAKYADTISKQLHRQKNPSAYDLFRLILLRQQAGLPVKTDSLVATKRSTMFGNVYWGEDSYRFFDNSIQLSVLAYQILRNEGKHPELLNKIRGYFLEQRKDAEWRNTYETSLILQTILPDLLTENKTIRPPVLTLSGIKNGTVTQFPYTASLTAGILNITKTGSMPVYVTGYQQFWNSKPERVSKDFTVNSWFERKGDKTTKLKGGEPVQLNVEVTARGDADYVMINIPVPAGCSYEDKEQAWGNEVHREYFKDRVSIFCRKLKQGTYTFTVNLLPRYSGNYHINPAKAEMMYFPVFYGREKMKEIAIE